MKCKHHKKCKYYEKDEYTCNNYDAENDYCGMYREFEEAKK